MYAELEKDLLLESSKVASEQFYEKDVSDLKEAYLQQQKQIEKLMREKSTTTQFDGSTYGVTS